MEKNIYAMMNEADICLDDYEQETLSDIEKQKMKKTFRKTINKKQPFKRNLLAAGLVAITITLGTFGMQNKALAYWVDNSFIGSIASFLGIHANLDEYKTIIDKTMTDSGISLKLKEVILDDNELLVYYNVRSDRKLSENEVWSPDASVYVNGEEMNCASGGSAHNIDAYTTEAVETFDLNRSNLDDTLRIKLDCSKISLGSEEQSGSWDFTFKTSGNQLKLSTKEVKLNNSFTLENGAEYTLQKYTSNSLGQKIYATARNLRDVAEYDIKLIGTDDLGNKVEFYMSHGQADKALFKIDRIDCSIKENAKFLMLAPYAAKYPEKSGRMDGEFKKVSESFRVNLEELK